MRPSTFRLCQAVMLAMFTLLLGDKPMANSGAATEADKLFDILNADKVHPVELDAASKNFSDAAKNQVVARAAGAFEPPPRGPLLQRLLFIITERNKADITTVFIANLRSPLPDARQASLQALEKLEHPALVQFALVSMRDTSDTVVAVACQILIARAKEDPLIRNFVERAYLARRGKKEFYLSNSILEAHGITGSKSLAK